MVEGIVNHWFAKVDQDFFGHNGLGYPFVFANGDGNAYQVPHPVGKAPIAGRHIIHNYLLPALFVAYALQQVGLAEFGGENGLLIKAVFPGKSLPIGAAWRYPHVGVACCHGKVWKYCKLGGYPQ